MNKINKKGFTLIELLAVITIMGILMIVAIPAVSRTIENARKDMFVDTAKQYLNAVKTLWTTDSLECYIKEKEEYVTYSELSSEDDRSFYVFIDTSKTGTKDGDYDYPVLLESGGKSPWGNKDLVGYIVMEGGSLSPDKINYGIILSDGNAGLEQSKTESNINRDAIKTSGVSKMTAYTKNVCRNVE